MLSMKTFVLLLGLSVALGNDVPSTPCGNGVSLAANSPNFENQWCAQCSKGIYKCVEVQSTVKIELVDSTDNAGATTADNVVTYTGNFGALGEVGSKAPQLIKTLSIKDNVSSTRNFNFRFSAVAPLARLETLQLTNVNVIQQSTGASVLPSSLSTLSIDRCTMPSAGVNFVGAQLTTLRITSSNLTNAIALDLSAAPLVTSIDLSNNQFTEIPLSLIKLVESGKANAIRIIFAGNPLDTSKLSSINPSTLNAFVVDGTRSPSSIPPATTMASPQPPPSASRDAALAPTDSSNVGSIVAGVATACAVLAILGFALLHRRRSLKSDPLLGQEVSRHMSSLGDDDGTSGEYKSEPVTTPRFSAASSDAAQLPLDARHGYAVLQRTELRQVKKSACGFFTAEYNNSVRVLVQKLELIVMADEEATDNLATSVCSRVFVRRLPLLASLQHANVLPLLGAVKLSPTSMYALFGPTSTQANASSNAVVSLSSLLYQDPKKPQAEDLTWKTQKKWCLDIARAIEYLHAVPWETSERARTSAQYIVLDDAPRTCQAQCMSYLDVSGVLPSQVFGANALAWTAPELVRQDRSDTQHAKAQVFAMAVVFGEIVTRQRPFAASWRARGPVRADVAVMHLLTQPETATPIVPHEFDASVPAEFTTLVRQCLNRDPQKRPSPTEVIAALSQCQ